MKSAKKTPLLILALLAVIGVTALTALHGQTQKSSSAAHQDNLKRAQEDFYTVTDYEAAEPTEARKRALRRVRAERHNMRVQKGVDPRRFMLTEDRESSFATPPFDVPLGSPLPATTSDAVVVGEVSNAEAFLTEDKTAIISEFTVQLSEVLKDNPTVPLVSGTSIDVNRSGGAVRFASGKVIRQGMFGSPLPRVGRKYVFFLKYDSEGQDFKIVTAYELNAGRIAPLDGISIDGNPSNRYPDYQKYRGWDEGTFLNEVRQAVINISVGGRAK